MAVERLAFRPAEVAAMLGLSADEVRIMCHSGALRHRRRGRAIVIPREAIEEWLHGKEQTTRHRDGLRLLE
jgi:excisionase family DNA binding protein